MTDIPAKSTNLRKRGQTCIHKKWKQSKPPATGMVQSKPPTPPLCSTIVTSLLSKFILSFFCDMHYTGIVPCVAKACPERYTFRALLPNCSEPSEQQVWSPRLYENTGEWSTSTVLQHNHQWNQTVMENLLCSDNRANRELWNCSNSSSKTNKQVSKKNCVLFNVCNQMHNAGHTKFLFFMIFSTFCSHDCGFHMLMHAQHWDGRLVCELHGNDIPNIRKILAHTWLSYEENDVDWESILNAE